MPNVYGRDIQNAKLISESPDGQAMLDKIAEIESSTASYIVLCCGLWYEWSLANGEQWFGFDIKHKKVVFYDDGKTKISVSTWLQCGKAIAALLSLPELKRDSEFAVEDWKDKPVYISSWRVSQRDMLDSIHRVTGDSDGDWTIEYEATDKRYRDGQVELKNGDFKGFVKSMYARAFYPNGGGDFEVTRGLDNEKLGGLPRESLDEATARVLKMLDDGWNPFDE